MTSDKDIGKCRYVFAGNRAYVLQEMLELGLNIVRIWAVKGSYLENYLEAKGIQYTRIENKQKLCEDIESTEFDYFISNGLPIILPVGELKREKEVHFINVHPSLLPDLRGRDPIPGALLYHRDSGATCHVMDDGIDTGCIISQVRIPMTEDLDAGLLYQLSFRAEADAFEQAFKRGFRAVEEQNKGYGNLYYSFREEDLLIDPEEECSDTIVDRVRAFSTKNKRARIQIDNAQYIVSRAYLVTNSYANSLFRLSPESRVLMTYENNILLKVKGKLMSWQIECEKIYEKSAPKFPIIGAVIRKIGGG